MSVPAARLWAGELGEGHVLAPQDVSLRPPPPRQCYPQHAGLSQISAETRRPSPQWESLERERGRVKLWQNWISEYQTPIDGRKRHTRPCREVSYQQFGGSSGCCSASLVKCDQSLSELSGHFSHFLGDKSCVLWCGQEFKYVNIKLDKMRTSQLSVQIMLSNYEISILYKIKYAKIKSLEMCICIKIELLHFNAMTDDFIWEICNQ